MKFFKKYIFPALYGLLVYFTIRLLHDTVIGEHFWKRDWGLNFLEMGCSVVAGFLGIYLFEWLFRFYDRRWPVQFCYQGVVRELAILVGSNLVLLNIILTPMAALTDDGLSWADVADINTIPTLYAIVYYGIVRASTYLKAYVDNKVQLEKVTNEHLQTELKFLKAQYHPHFLFNALNTIYFQMDEDHEGAKRSIEKFSELLRYQLYDQQQQVPVMQEIEYLQSFIELQKIRSTDKLKLKVDFDGRLNGQLVYPLLFLPLVENAFKYSTRDDNRVNSIRIRLQQLGNRIVFQCSNSYEREESITGGIGISNVTRRLELLYKGRYELDIQKDPTTYSIQLILTV